MTNNTETVNTMLQTINDLPSSATSALTVMFIATLVYGVCTKAIDSGYCMNFHLDKESGDIDFSLDPGTSNVK